MKTQRLFVGSTLLVGLLGCSNPRIETVPSVTTRPLYEKDLPLDQASRLQMHVEALAKADSLPLPNGQAFVGQICQVGGPSCLEIDDRPFETCLLASQDCGEKLRESLRRGESFGPLQPGPAR